MSGTGQECLSRRGYLRSSIFLILLSPFLLPTVSVHARTGPRIACKEPEYIFGEAHNTGSIDHAFVISNEGDMPLNIGKIRSCCGATAGIAQEVIAPGSNTTFRVSLSLRGRTGPQKKSFYIASNDPNHPYFQVQMTGTATTEVSVDLVSVDFGKIGLTDEMEKSVKIKHAPAIVMAVTNVVVDQPKFAVTFENLASGCLVKVRTISPNKPGVTQGNMRILTDNAKYPLFDVHLIASVSSDILVVPQEIALVETAGNMEPVTRYLAIRSRANKPFRILKIEPPDSGIEVKIEGLPTNGYRCELKNILPFSELDGKMFIVRTDHEDGREIAIPIRFSKKTGI